MIPADAITAWSVTHPWPTREQVEQDLLLSRAICAIARDDYLGDELVFRGGTALHKLHLDPPVRYSEDLTSHLAVANLQAKLRDRQFRTDLEPLLRAQPSDYDVDAAAAYVIEHLLTRLDPDTDGH